MARKPKVLTQKNIEKQLASLTGWTVNKKADQLLKTIPLPSFITALAFVAKVAVLAEVMDHHPDIELSYGKVKIKLKTHDVKGLTKLDFDLAKKIDRIKLPQGLS